MFFLSVFCFDDSETLNLRLNRFIFIIWSDLELILQVGLILKRFESYCRELAFVNRLSRELPFHFIQFGSISANTTYFRTGFSSNPHSNTRKF